MNPFQIVHFSEIFYHSSLILCIITCIMYSSSNSCRLLLHRHSILPITGLVILCILLFGLRQLTWDSAIYAYGYRNSLMNNTTIAFGSEWFWNSIATTCMKLRLQDWQWLFVVALGYIGLIFWSCKIVLWENVFLAMVFFFTSFSFMSYGTNTLRSGFACSVLLLSLSFWVEKKPKLICWFLFFAAFGTHRSCLLTILAFIGAEYFIKKPQQAFLIWGLSFIVSLVFGQTIGNILVNMGFDARVNSYLAETTNARSFYHAGFRMDFVIYGAAPILLYWYVAVKRKIRDPKFDLLSITYILSNAIWLQFIRFAYTDRFAYLSWFMMPMVLAYASIRIPIWPDQDRKAAGVLALQGLFTFGMHFILGK